ncbi:MerR family transcriptional regulator [Commensalibacter communis]|uniref:MerR family (SoxR) n=1 Tax=Commensalibacter communis TaxID=2972786 RepID=A0A9W4X6Z2_9PROT|nr:MerR family transcriptional regulator [Commensalibacter communis]CAI3947364.1 DNA-binding transcriptional regulator [Commensalibacter communis]CAI3947823.1 DNA-binding transcriptional regulator [Commensalibacter communis]CAI3951031.1 DNA-binding transcriptional regulator [Commensalibacter communis]CAI3951036.1 DNA-binding transcriptional regulator [Commensalibacter communis]CAI3955483.1 DNA-binding transcriptional regulator [Commensalibacter communis]
MSYTIHQVAKKLNINPHTIRYYAKEGLFPFVDRNAAGVRIFQETDVEWASLIQCLKNSGMKLKDIKQFIDWVVQGDSTINQRLEFFRNHQRNVEQQLAELQEVLKVVKYKRKYYEEAKKSL